MDFGRLADPAQLETVNFALPDEAPATTRMLAELAPASTPDIYIGCPIWNHPGLAEQLYPPATPPGEYLRHYARHFNTIELNTTYYGTRPGLLRRWHSMVAPEFRFVPKLVKTVSHDRRLRQAESETLQFCNSLTELGANLGPVFALLPGDFGPAQFVDLARFVTGFPQCSRLPLGTLA